MPSLVRILGEAETKRKHGNKERHDQHEQFLAPSPKPRMSESTELLSRFRLAGLPAPARSLHLTYLLRFTFFDWPAIA